MTFILFLWRQLNMSSFRLLLASKFVSYNAYFFLLCKGYLKYWSFQVKEFFFKISTNFLELSLYFSNCLFLCRLCHQETKERKWQLLIIIINIDALSPIASILYL